MNYVVSVKLLIYYLNDDLVLMGLNLQLFWSLHLYAHLTNQIIHLLLLRNVSNIVKHFVNMHNVYLPN
ncbi:unnamed protein product [Schistosoma curassoni]|uniref:Uncharacterized protein n=1 Tax=Schistosoma curassoni TaxID=6186 RepID=A0A183JSJ6_9TREM|nr:unnamed protein product [Schistosoma curassoni]